MFDKLRRGQRLFCILTYAMYIVQCIHSALHNMVLSRYSFSGIYSFSETENISQGFKAEKIPFSGIKTSPSGALMFRKRRIVTANGLNDPSKKYKQHNCRLQMSLVPAIWTINTFYLYDGWGWRTFPLNQFSPLQCVPSKLHLPP